MSQTQEILSGMLKEDTGRAMCDSGGDPKYDDDGNYIGSEFGFGRNHEYNSRIDFDKQQPTVLRFDVWRGEFSYIDITHNVYHWLDERLEYDEEANQMFDQLAEANPNDSWYELRDKFADYYVEQLNARNEEQVEARGIYGDGEPVTVNTYNYDNLLSQTLLFVYFELHPKSGRHPYHTPTFVVLQIHGGADVRGGYTKPAVFRMKEDLGELCILDYNRAGLYCTGEGHHPTAPKPEPVGEDESPAWWDHRWFNDGGDASKPTGWSSDDHSKVDDMDNYEIKVLKDGDEWEQGKLCMTEDGVGYCPECGAQLAASSY